MARPKDLSPAERKESFKEFRAGGVTVFIQEELASNSGVLRFILPDGDEFKLDLVE